MGKPSKEVFLKFMEAFNRKNKEAGLKQFVVPYFISSHPGATLEEAVELAEFLHKYGFYPEQVQDFIPTPGSYSTAMYYSETDPETGEAVYVAKKLHDKAMQRALLQYKNPKNRTLVYEALKKVNRLDLVGTGPECLLRKDVRQVVYDQRVQGNLKIDGQRKRTGKLTKRK